jgi:DNA-binding transcriptional LysR family regulator
MKPLDLNLLRALDALLSTGSVSAAAQQMHLSTPAMSHTLARIREALHDPILVRAGRRLVPTPRAEALRAPVSRLVAEAQALMQPPGVEQLAQLQREFVVRAPEGMGILYGPVLLDALRKELPQATLRFVPESDSDAAALREGRIDLDVGALPDRDPETQTALLYEQQLVGVVATGHALMAARVTTRRFSAEEHVAIAQRGRAADPVDASVAAAGQRRNVVLTVPSAYGALMAVARSKLVACVPDFLARTVATRLRLQVFALPFAVPAQQVLQAWHPRFNADPAHQCLRHCVARLSPVVAAGPLASRDAIRQKAREMRSHRALLT